MEYETLDKLTRRQRHQRQQSDHSLVEVVSNMNSRERGSSTDRSQLSTTSASSLSWHLARLVGLYYRRVLCPRWSRWRLAVIAVTHRVLLRRTTAAHVIYSCMRLWHINSSNGASPDYRLMRPFCWCTTRKGRDCALPWPGGWCSLFERSLSRRYVSRSGSGLTSAE